MMMLEGYSSLDPKSLKKYFVQLCKSEQAQHIIKHQYVKKYEYLEGRLVTTHVTYIRLRTGKKYKPDIIQKISGDIIWFSCGSLDTPGC